MKHTLIITALGLLASNAALANADLARAKSCMACHTVDRKIVGPSFKDIALRYRADKGAEAKLAGKLRAGSSGAWGKVPMPPNPQLSDADARQLARWILTQK